MFIHAWFSVYLPFLLFSFYLLEYSPPTRAIRRSGGDDDGGTARPRFRTDDAVPPPRAMRRAAVALSVRAVTGFGAAVLLSVPPTCVQDRSLRGRYRQHDDDDEEPLTRNGTDGVPSLVVRLRS